MSVDSKKAPVNQSIPYSFVLTEEFCGSVKDLAEKGFTKDRIDRLWVAIHKSARESGK